MSLFISICATYCTLSKNTPFAKQHAILSDKWGAVDGKSNPFHAKGFFYPLRNGCWERTLKSRYLLGGMPTILENT